MKFASTILLTATCVMGVGALLTSGCDDGRHSRQIHPRRCQTPPNTTHIYVRETPPPPPPRQKVVIVKTKPHHAPPPPRVAPPRGKHQKPVRHNDKHDKPSTQRRPAEKHHRAK